MILAWEVATQELFTSIVNPKSSFVFTVTFTLESTPTLNVGPFVAHPDHEGPYDSLALNIVLPLESISS